MKYLSNFKNREQVTYVLLLVVSCAFFYVLVTDAIDSEKKDRDATRLSDVSQIRYALRAYHEKNGQYPACLYKMANCTSLEGGTELKAIPLDPLTNNQYNYAAFGVGTECVNYHIGSSLERTASQALLTGSDAPPQPKSALCKGSGPDFSGLSHTAGGEPCDLDVGIAQPTDSSKGETCFDLRR